MRSNFAAVPMFPCSMFERGASKDRDGLKGHGKGELLELLCQVAEGFGQICSGLSRRLMDQDWPILH